jgi:beta-lactamase class A
VTEPFEPAVRGCAWSVLAVELGSGATLYSSDADRVQPVASIGKLMLLATVAAMATEGRLDLRAPLARDDVAPVADSGLWQHLSVAELPIGDLAVLTGALSDNLATNVLLRFVGLDAVERQRTALGLEGPRLLDQVRDVRTAGDPETLSTASARQLVEFFVRLSNGALVGDAGDALLRSWLAPCYDHSMVSSAFLLDPLAHAESTAAPSLWSKTGADALVRGEAGVVSSEGRSVAFAVLADWSVDGSDLHVPVLEAMRAFGAWLAGELEG